MSESRFPFTPAQLAFVDQMEADTLALVRIGKRGIADVKRFHMSYADCARALRTIADELDAMATEGAQNEGH